MWRNPWEENQRNGVSSAWREEGLGWCSFSLPVLESAAVVERKVLSSQACRRTGQEAIGTSSSEKKSLWTQGKFSSLWEQLNSGIGRSEKWWKSLTGIKKSLAWQTPGSPNLDLCFQEFRSDHLNSRLST